MRANLEKMKDLVMSEHVMLALVDKGVAKEEAYRTVQAVAMEAFESGGDFQELVAQDPTISGKLSEAELAECFDYEKHLKRVEAAYERVGV
jgi:adenylosuccinate lyase